MHAASGTDTVPSGYENLRKPEVAAYLAERQQALQERTEITQEMAQKDYGERGQLIPARVAHAQKCSGRRHSTAA